MKFNGSIHETRETWAARLALTSWWADCPPAQFYTMAKQEAPRMRGSAGARWVQGMHSDQARQFEGPRTVPWAGR